MKFSLPTIKFSFPLSELLDAYKNYDTRFNHLYLCEFVKQKFLPSKSIFHKFYLTLARPNSSLLDNLTLQFDTKTCYVLESAFKDHPDFKDIPVKLSIRKYRIKVLQRMLQLQPDLKFTFTFNSKPTFD
jgi:hypothetical protein